MSSTPSLLVAALALVAVPACMEVTPDTGESELEARVAKVTICHVPPGNPSNAHTISVGAPAVDAHLAHGDHLGECAPACEPEPEVCGDGLDQDCDGVADDGCCVATAEACDGADNDCDGAVDEGLPAVACYDGPPGTEGVGACSSGVSVCASGGYGDCAGQVTPAAEACGDAVDNDCDGQTDEGCCAALPERCDGADNDCDGVVDEGCIGERVWNDLGSDGLQSAGEPGVGGATLLLRAASSGALVAVTVSDANGTYWFSGVPAGEYYIEAVPPAGYNYTVPDAGDDTLDSDFDMADGVTAPFVYGGTVRSDLDLGLRLFVET